MNFHSAKPTIKQENTPPETAVLQHFMKTKIFFRQTRQK